jgi:hypothetical protein
MCTVSISLLICSAYVFVTFWRHWAWRFGIVSPEAEGMSLLIFSQNDNFAVVLMFYQMSCDDIVKPILALSLLMLT